MNQISRGDSNPSHRVSDVLSGTQSERAESEAGGRMDGPGGEFRWGGLILVGLSAIGFVLFAAMTVYFVVGLVL